MPVRLGQLADLLFGTTSLPEHIGRQWLLRYLGLAAVLALVIFARRPDAVLMPQLGGDGKVFFQPQLTVGFWSALWSFYGGFPFLGERLIAALGSLVPTVAVPLVYSMSTITITALTTATFSLPRFRHLVRSDGVRAATCVAAICVTAAESLAIMGHSGYCFVIWLLFLSVMQTPSTFAGAAVWCLGGALAVLSAPLAPIAAPLCLLRGFRAVGRRDGRELSFAVIQAAAQLVVLGIGGLLLAGVLQGSELPVSLPVFSEWQPGYRWATLPALGWAMASCVDAALLSDAVFERLEKLGTLAVIAPALTVAVVIALAFRNLLERGRATVCLAIYVMTASLALILIGRPITVLLFYGAVPKLDLGTLAAIGERHRTVFDVALLLLAAGIIDGARRIRTRVTAAVVTCAALLVAWAPGFRIPPSRDCHWPLWAARLDRKLATGSHERLVIPMCVPTFDMVFDSPPSAAPDLPRTRDQIEGRR